MAPENEPAWMIAVNGLRKRLGGQVVLDGIDLTVARGETLAVIGRSGGGKSVLMKHLAGLICPDEGEVRIDGVNLCGLNERQLGPVRRKIGILFQDGALFDSMTVSENVAFPLRERGVRDRGEIARRVEEALAHVSLEGQGEKMPVELSGGMRKRASLARVLASQPACILYDEPTSGLDPVVSDSINHLIRDLQVKFGVTSVVVTHDMTSAYFVADRIAFLRAGSIYLTGVAGDFRTSQDPVIRDFVEGRSRGNDWMNPGE